MRLFLSVPRSHSAHKKAAFSLPRSKDPAKPGSWRTTSPPAGSHISLISPARGRPAPKQPRRGGAGDVLLGRVPSSSCPRCHLKATGWHSAGCEQPLPVTTGWEAPAPLATSSEIPRADRGNKRGLQNPGITAHPDLPSSAGERTHSKADVSHLLYNYHTPAAMDVTDLSHQSCERH